MTPRLELHRTRGYPLLHVLMRTGLPPQEAIALRPSLCVPGQADLGQTRVLLFERFLNNPDPIKLWKLEVREGRAKVYRRTPLNDYTGGADHYTILWEGFYATFAWVENRYPVLRRLGAQVVRDGPVTPAGVFLTIQQVPVPMRHALAGWLRMKYDELSHVDSPYHPLVPRDCPPAVEYNLLTMCVAVARDRGVNENRLIRLVDRMCALWPLMSAEETGAVNARARRTHDQQARSRGARKAAPLDPPCG